MFSGFVSVFVSVFDDVILFMVFIVCLYVVVVVFFVLLLMDDVSKIFWLFVMLLLCVWFLCV